MGWGFELEIRKAEQTINHLIEAIQREGGAVYIQEHDSIASLKLTQPIGISYFIPILREKE